MTNYQGLQRILKEYFSLKGRINVLKRLISKQTPPEQLLKKVKEHTTKSPKMIVTKTHISIITKYI